ncbi:hypothetical protein [Arthrobacter sp. A5]|uniref:hypothetical protein n=1 Tax=Arthrobacter sp. A5 TaxID=576926 RepID=UPI003DAA3F9B
MNSATIGQLGAGLGIAAGALVVRLGAGLAGGGATGTPFAFGPDPLMEYRIAFLRPRLGRGSRTGMPTVPPAPTDRP